MTLVELLVAMTILTVVISGAVALFVSVIHAQSGQVDRNAKVGLTRTSLERMVRELRQGLSVDTATASQVSFRTYVRTTCAGGSASTAILCRVTYTCSGTTCTRTLANADGTAPGAAVTFVRGISNSATVFTYTGSPTTYVGIKFAVPTKDQKSNVTLQDGASLRNATLSL